MALGLVSSYPSGVFCCRCGDGSLLELLLRSVCIFLLFRGMCSWRAADIISGKKDEKRSDGAKLPLSRNMNLEFEVRRMNITGHKIQTTKTPNQSLEPTALLVTPRAFARVAPSSAVAHL